MLKELSAKEKKLLEKKEKQEAKMQAEIARTHTMKTFENRFYEEGFSLLAGIDEVGRGPLAGPVVTAAVILPKDFFVLGINDSKKLSEKKREELYEEITEKAIAFSVGVVDNQTIDEINILNATKMAMKQAIEKLQVQPDYLMIDAVTLQDVDMRQIAIIKGDEKSISIAAASIVAKVTRDKMMQDYDKAFPGYDFYKNKGYGTKAHYEGIKEQGITSIHRKSFLKGIL